MGDLEALQAVAGLSLLAADVEHGVDQLSTLGVVTLGPVVAGASLSEDEVVRAEDLAVRTSANGVHGAGLEIHENSARNVAPTRRLVEVDVDALQLEVAVALVRSGRVNAVLVRNNFPELCTDLVTALAALNAHDLTHVLLFWFVWWLV